VPGMSLPGWRPSPRAKVSQINELLGVMTPLPSLAWQAARILLPSCDDEAGD
jgi:hypothetical protein